MEDDGPCKRGGAARQAWDEPSGFFTPVNQSEAARLLLPSASTQRSKNKEKPP